jgi:ubiquitin carboxyl-terminal hydrolase 48
MLFSFISALDPNDFVTKLGLDPQVQQDAQEFSKLFMTLLESCLASQTNPKVKDIVKNQFSGEYAYVTICSVCNRESSSTSQFNELLLIIQVRSLKPES